MAVSKIGVLQDKLAKMRREAEERSAERLAKELGFIYIDLRHAPVSLEAMKLIPENDAKDAKMVAIELKLKHIAVATFDPRLSATQKVLETLKSQKYEPKIFIASLSGLRQAWQFYRFVAPETSEITGKVEIKKQRLEELSKKLSTFGAVQSEVKTLDFNNLVTTELLEIVLAGALANRASDIHLEAEEKRARIRYRIDGMLHDIYTELPLRQYHSIVNRLKLFAGMKINITGEAQDGRFTIGFASKDVEVRVSVIPSEFGETIVMRLLDPDVISVELPNLGLREDDLEIAKKHLAQPNGLILNTGPTGSGKTTTLYAFLRFINSTEVKVITLEDPIEYRLEGIEQTQVDPEVNYTFANGLRAIVRQDPDVILVGEVRDLETAEIAMQSALTGHLVLSTLHTNDAVGAVPRLINLGVKPQVIGPALSLVIAQRLVRRLCSDCKKEIKPTAELQAKIKKYLGALPARVDRTPYEKPEIYEPVGCEKCSHFGYRGRVAIFEFFESTTEFEEDILKEVSEGVLLALARKQQMVTMQEDGVLKTLSGLTSFAEVEEITGPIEWK